MADPSLATLEVAAITEEAEKNDLIMQHSGKTIAKQRQETFLPRQTTIAQFEFSFNDNLMTHTKTHIQRHPNII